jgi:DNA-binding GntR family transcriptional regulator
MDRRTELKSTLRIDDVPTVRAIVAQKLREAIMSGTFKPGQRLVERELCEMTGVSRPSIREALRLLEADGMVNTVPHRGPVVSTISLEEARQLYDARAVLEGFAGRECARLRDPAVVRRMGAALTRLKAAFAKPDMIADRRVPERVYRTHVETAA